MKEIKRETKSHIEFRNTKSLDFPPHIHDDIELVYVLSGNCVAYCDGQKYHLKKNNYFLVFPNQIHHYAQSDENFHATLLIFKPSLLIGYKSLFDYKTAESALFDCEEIEDENLKELLKIAHSEYCKKQDQAILSAVLTAFFGKLLKYYSLIKSKTSSDRISEILQYCTKHYKEDISIERTAQDLLISKSLISHTFNEKLHMSFRDYINSLRLIEAVRLLKSEEYNITEIAYSCGFTTIRTFNRAFYKQYGISPSQFRKL